MTIWISAACSRCGEPVETTLVHRVGLAPAPLCGECLRREAVLASGPPPCGGDPFLEEPEPDDIGVCGPCEGRGEVVKVLVGQLVRDYASGALLTEECRPCGGTGSGFWGRGFVGRA